MSQTQTFEIGQKVSWEIGNSERPIKCEGLFLAKVSDTESSIKMTTKNGQRCIITLNVQSSLLNRQVA